MTGLGRHPHPFQLSFEGLAALALLLLFLRKARALLLQPGGIVALPGNAFAAVELEDPAGDIVQEITVVGDGDDRTLVLLEMRFQPLDALRVEMVRRLVQQQHVGLAEQQAAEGHPSAFASRKGGDLRIHGRALEGVHRPFQLGIDLPAVAMLDLFGQLALALDQAVHLVIIHRLHELEVDLLVFLKQGHHFADTLLDHLEDGLVRIHLRLLLEVADGIAGCPDHLALVGFLHTGDDLHQGGFAGTVEADDADLGPVEERKVDILENDLVVVGERLSDAAHREDDFFVCHSACFSFVPAR